MPKEATFLAPSRPRPFVQAKLSVGNVEDKYEREADNAADHIARNIFNNTVGTRPEISAIDEKDKIQRKTETNSNVLPSVIFEEKLNASQQSGEPLPDNLREMMQKSFGFNLSKVRIHADDYADELNRELHKDTLAFAYNEHIYFRKGKYRPDELNGVVLLAHEITHVLQQRTLEPLQEPKHDPLVGTVEEATPKGISKETKKSLPPKQKKQGRKRRKPSEEDKKTEKVTDEKAAELEKAAPKNSPRSPEEDPNFVKVVKKAKQQAKKAKKHDPAEKKTKDMQASVKLPDNEVESQAKSRQVDKMSQEKPAKFDANSFKQSLMEKVEKIAPKNLEEASDFKKNNTIEEVKQAVSGRVGEEKEKAAQDIQQTTAETPSSEGLNARPAKGLPPAGIGTINTHIGAKKASPSPRLPEEISLKAGSESLDRELKDGGVSEEQIKKSNEPSFSSALAQKNEAQQDSVMAPNKYRKEEKRIVSQAEIAANKLVTTELLEMHGDRKNQFEGVEQKQQSAKSEEETIREEIAKNLEAIYGDTKALVEERLAKLTAEVARLFDNGAKQAKERFENDTDIKMSAYKRRRYSGFWGPAKWIKDKLAGLPDEVNQFYEEGRVQYLSDMEAVITGISTHVAFELNAATEDIANGRKKVQDYFSSLDENQKRIGQGTFDEALSRFEELESKVEDTQGELIDSLADKYKENLQQLDARIEAMKEANKGLVSKAIGAIKGVIKTIRELKDLLLRVLSKVAKAIGYIILHPISFLGNLISAVGQGVKNFAKNILSHLQKGFLKWLTGAAGDVQIEIPDSLDPIGMFKMVCSVIGLTVENFMERAARKIPAPILEGLKQAQGVIKIVMEKGVIGLWEYLKDQVESILVGAKEAVFDFMQNKIIEAGVDFILKMLTPAGAFIKACQAIYKIIKFIWENAKRILQFIEGILDAILDIAAGNLSNAIKKVENSLADAIPLAIGFLAGLLNLDGIPKKVIEILKKIKGRIDLIIDTIILKAWEYGKTIVGKAIAGGKKIVKAVFNWIKSLVRFKTADGENHKLYFKEIGGAYKIIVESTPQTYAAFIGSLLIDPTHRQKDQLTKDKDSAKKLAEEIDKWIDASEKDEKDRSSDIEKNLLKLGPLTARLMMADKQTAKITNKKSSKPVFGGLTSGGGFGKSVRIEYFSELTTGSDADGKGNAIYTKLNQRKSGNGSYYVQGHLLSAKLHGTGKEWENLTPLTRQANALHVARVESKLKEVVEKKRAFMYVVTPSYGRGKNTDLMEKINKSNDTKEDKKIKKEIVEAEQYVPTSLVCTIKELDTTASERQEKAGGMVVNEKIENTIDANVADYQVLEGPVIPIFINEANAEELMEIDGIGEITAEKIVELRTKQVYFRNREDIFDAFKNISKDKINNAYNKGKINFRVP